MPKQREVPRDMFPSDDEMPDRETGPQYIFIAHAERRPENEFQALMECAPFEEPDVSRDERLELRDVIVDALDNLTDQEQWIFDSLFVRRLSLRQLATEINMPKTTVARWRDRLLQRLREKLVNEPQIVNYLEGSTE